VLKKLFRSVAHVLEPSGLRRPIWTNRNGGPRARRFQVQGGEWDWVLPALGLSVEKSSRFRYPRAYLTTGIRCMMASFSTTESRA
jgi:hypothetical protein